SRHLGRRRLGPGRRRPGPPGPPARRRAARRPPGRGGRRRPPRPGPTWRPGPRTAGRPGRPRPALAPPPRTTRAPPASAPVGIADVLLHADAVAKERPARERARRIDGDHPDATVEGAPGGDQGVGEGGLARTGSAGDPDQVRWRTAPPGVHQHGPGLVVTVF